MTIHVNPDLGFVSTCDYLKMAKTAIFIHSLLQKRTNLYLSDLSTRACCKKRETDETRAQTMPFPCTFLWVFHESLAH